MKVVAGIVGFVAFVAALMLLARSTASTPPAPAPVAARAPAPARAPVVAEAEDPGPPPPLPALFVFKDDAHADSIGLAGPRAKPALLHLWASWCGPCRAELPSILAIAKAGKYDVLAVSVDDRFPDVRAYFHGKIPAEVVWDKNITLERALGVENIPTTFLVDRTGAVIDRWDGAQDWVQIAPELAKLRL